MTDQQPHTPLTDTVREVYSFAGAQAPSVRKQWFDRWLATIEAAAEQRGAIKALRDAAESPDLIGHMYREYDDHPLRSTLAPAAVRATSNYLHNRADQIEGDDEKH